jgi:hypothetical protein
VSRGLPEKREAGRRLRVEPAPKICTHWQALQVFSYHKPSDLPSLLA